MIVEVEGGRLKADIRRAVIPAWAPTTLRIAVPPTLFARTDEGVQLLADISRTVN